MKILVLLFVHLAYAKFLQQTPDTNQSYYYNEDAIIRLIKNNDGNHFKWLINNQTIQHSTIYGVRQNTETRKYINNDTNTEILIIKSKIWKFHKQLYVSCKDNQNEYCKTIYLNLKQSNSSFILPIIIPIIILSLIIIILIITIIVCIRRKRKREYYLI